MDVQLHYFHNFTHSLADCGRRRIMCLSVMSVCMYLYFYLSILNMSALHYNRE